METNKDEMHSTMQPLVLKEEEKEKKLEPGEEIVHKLFNFFWKEV